MRGVVVLLVLAGAAGCSTARHATPPPANVSVEPAKQQRSSSATDELADLEDPDARRLDSLYALRMMQDPRDPRAVMARAVVRQRAGDTEGARRLYRAVLALEPGFAPAYSNLGALLLEADRVDEALELLFEGAARVPDHPGVWANLAGALARSERWDEAISASETAIELQPRDADLRRNHAAILYRSKRPEDAERALKSALAEFPEDAPDFLMRLSELYQSRGEEDRALEMLERVSQLVPGLPLPYLRRAAILGRRDDLAGTLRVLVEGLEHNPDDEDLRKFFMAAMALRLQRDLEEGMDRIAANSADVEAYLQVARVHEVGRDMHAALDVLNDGVRHNPASSALWSQLGAVQGSLQREREALDSYRHAINLDRSSAVALNNCAYLLVTAQDASLRNQDEAFRFATAAVSLEPDNPSFVDTLAEVHWVRGDARRARELIGRALELKPGDPWLQAQVRRFESQQPGGPPPSSAQVRPGIP